MANDALMPNTVKTMMLMLSAIFNARNTFTVAPAAPKGDEPSGRLPARSPGRSLFYLDAGHLPHRATVVFLHLQFRIAVKGIDDEERPLVAHCHVFAVALQREDYTVFADVFHRHLGAVIIERDRDDAIAGSADGIHQLGERHALELDRLLVPWRAGGERGLAQRFKHSAIELSSSVLVGN